MAKAIKPKPVEKGRPSKYKPEYIKIAKAMYELGATDVQVASCLNITEQTFYNWQNKYPDFVKAKLEAKEAPDSAVELSLYRRAMGMTLKETAIEEIEGAETPGKKRTIIKEIPPDPTAMIFWLKNRKPAEWRDKQIMEHEVSEDSGLIVITGKVSVEEWEAAQKGS